MNKKINSIKIFLLCPIPDEQKPVNEYLILKKYLDKEKYEVTDFEKNDFVQLAIIDSKIILKFFEFFINEVSKLASNIFFIVRWKEIEKRLNQSSLIYEEASWYDGQIWEKPFFIIKNDRLINSQIIQLILQKMIFFLFVFLNIFFISFVSFYCH
jgi:hypothetical protein